MPKKAQTARATRPEATKKAALRQNCSARGIIAVLRSAWDGKGRSAALRTLYSPMGRNFMAECLLWIYDQVYGVVIVQTHTREASTGVSLSGPAKCAMKDLLGRFL